MIPNTQAHSYLPEQRATLIIAALDHALAQLADISLSQVASFSRANAYSAVKLSECESQSVARSALAWLNMRNVGDVEIITIHEHYVLKDMITGRMHDLEMPDGRHKEYELPWVQRNQQLSNLRLAGELSDQHRELIFSHFALQLTEHRRALQAESEWSVSGACPSRTDRQNRRFNHLLSAAGVIALFTIVYQLLHISYSFVSWPVVVYFVAVSVIIVSLLRRISCCNQV